MLDKLHLLDKALSARRVAASIINPAIAERVKALAEEFEQAAGINRDERQSPEKPKPAH
jgi:hypothetical protein